ncbi:hypothetical protein Glove_118g2 [Diversispora epigaea]|uniref:DUF659 domain-containing protein n=1 Tax=Diversispora epigaea TaxID=1348612 RepID=A0A397J069_9GLOM|nr:hypothetical protein Glove_118g2 [Diversispora epigaea]
MVQNLKKYIVTTSKKSGSSNKLCYCKACYDKYGENNPELKAIVDKTNRILSHFRNCRNFDEAYELEEKETILSLASKKKTNLGKRSANNLSNNSNQPAKIQRNISFSSQASSSSAQTLSFSNYGPLDNFITRPLSNIDKKKFNLLILRVTISCGFALSWVNNPEVIELFKFLNPLIKLPNRKTLSDKILHEAVTDLNNTMIEKLESDRIGITLSFDGWINVREQELMGTIIMSSDGQPYVWKAIDVSGERHKTDDVIAKTEEMITEIRELNLVILAIVTDSAPAYNAARLRLRNLHRELVFLPCYAHQVNLCVGEIFKVSPEFKTTSTYALKIAAYFKNANNKYFIGQLRTIQKEIYGKYIQPMIPGDTRWNSYLTCCSSIKATKNALRSLATKFEPSQSNARRRPNDPLTISQDIYLIIMNENFWENLIKLEQLLIPYCQILNILQTDKARLYEVLHGFAYLTQFWKKYIDSNMANRILTRLQKRWESWEQPLLILSWLLHPSYRTKYFTLPSSSKISYLHMGKWLVYYYKAWTGCDPQSILVEFDDFFQGKNYPFDNETICQFENNIYKYWCWIKDAYPEIGTVASRIFGICVNAASVERLWSNMGFYHTKNRNKLKYTRVLDMAKLRADITYNRRFYKESIVSNIINSTLETETQDNELETEIQEVNSESEIQDINHEINMQDIDSETESLIEENEVSNNSEDDENNNIDIEDISQKFTDHLSEWMGILETETNNSEFLENGIEDIDHPAINIQAKWNLDIIFKDNLPCPFD